MTAAVLTVGSELVRGELADQNGHWLAARLTSMGFAVRSVACVGDEVSSVRDALRAMAQAASVVLVTGGLGPATDDVTVRAAAEAAGVGLLRDPMVLESLRRKLQGYGRVLTPALEKLADLPDGAEVLGATTGIAPAYRMAIGSAAVYLLPGDPDEATRHFDDHVARRIGALGRPDGYQVVVRTCGLPESAVVERLAGLDNPSSGVRVSLRAHAPEVDVRVHARSLDVAEARAAAERVAVEVRTRLGDAVYGDEHDHFAAAVGRALRARGYTLSVAESCTGGLIGSMLTAVPGASEYLLLDAVVYSNRAKESVLGVPSEVLRGHGAVSPECVRAMAEGARRVSEADLAVAVSGVAGPSGGSAEKPVGTVHFALSTAAGTEVLTRRFGGDRAAVQRQAAFAALALVRDACRASKPSSSNPVCG